jgi:hypothetical protein
VPGHWSLGKWVYAVLLEEQMLFAAKEIVFGVPVEKQIEKNKQKQTDRKCK